MEGDIALIRTEKEERERRDHTAKCMVNLVVVMNMRCSTILELRRNNKII